MLLYEYQVRDEFRRVHALAKRIHAKFESGAEPQDLLHDAPILEAAYAQLQKLLPKGVSGGNFNRHLSFMKTYLGRGDKNSCRGDINDICNFDIPALEQAFQDWCASRNHYDSELQEKISPLFLERQLDSAVRKGFVILKERLVKNFDLPASLDGRDLVNQVFGQRGCLAEKIPEPERESMRNLLNGIFGVFRNLYDHKDVEPEWHEVEATLSLINWALKRIDKYPSPYGDW